MRRRRQRQTGAVAAQGGLSAKSVIRAKSIAASILNMSENDLADIMDTDQVRVNMSYKHYISDTTTEKHLCTRNRLSVL